jgi:hypothetical protein
MLDNIPSLIRYALFIAIFYVDLYIMNYVGNKIKPYKKNENPDTEFLVVYSILAIVIFILLSAIVVAVNNLFIKQH